MTARLSIENVSRAFGDFLALDRVSLDVAAGEFIVLLGPSGCGKTTLLSILGGFLEPTSGKIMIGDRDMTHVAPAKRPTTTMFQDYALFPHMTLLDNVGFGLRMAGKSKQDRDKQALALLDMVGLKDSATRKPHELSGGQRQRVALARALAVEPDVLLLDEPLGALDLKLRRQMQDELKAIQKRVGTTFIHVTHDQEEAMAIADRIVVMNKGHIEDVGTPAQIYMRPRSLFSAGFMGEVNVIDGRVGKVETDDFVVITRLGDVRLPKSAITAGSPETGAPASIVVRPEQFRTEVQGADQIDFGTAEITDGAFFGTHFRCHVVASDLQLLVHLPQTASLEPGAHIALKTARAGIVALIGDEAGGRHDP